MKMRISIKDDEETWLADMYLVSFFEASLGLKRWYFFKLNSSNEMVFVFVF
jgi:hypothetical protein